MKAKIRYETKMPDGSYRQAKHAVPVETQGNETPANAFHRVFLATFGTTLEYRIVRVIKPRPHVYDYYEVSLPGDLEELDEENMRQAARSGQLDEYIERMANHAIDEARERSPLYCMPCEWRATLLSSLPSATVKFRVCRKRNAPQKKG